jgi:hypothetical protein
VRAAGIVAAFAAQFVMRIGERAAFFAMPSAMVIAMIMAVSISAGVPCLHGDGRGRRSANPVLRPT